MRCCIQAGNRHHGWYYPLVVAGCVLLARLQSLAADEPLTLEACPPAVQKTIRAEAGDGWVVEVEKESLGDEVVYEAEIAADGESVEILVREDGTLVIKVPENSRNVRDGEDRKVGKNNKKKKYSGRREQEDDENEITITMSQLPKPVRRTLRRESRGGEIEEIEREIKNGRIIYSADVEYQTEVGELIYEIDILENGILLRKILEDDDEEDDDEEHDDAEDADDASERRRESPSDKLDNNKSQ